jgi:hypothetical protein
VSVIASGDGERPEIVMMEAFEAWELRWIARHLPTLDATWRPTSSLDPALTAVREHDVYVLTPSDRINLKVRHRENSLKLKTLLERTDDGFERWRTDFDAPLPAGPERFRDVLHLIGRAGSPEGLGAAAEAGDVVNLLHAICDPSQLIPVHKTRQLYQRGTCRVDQARFRTAGGTYHSVGVESTSLDDLRALVQNLGQIKLTSPRNYTEFLAVRR